MNRRLLATIAVAVAIVGCAEDGEQSPTSPGLTGGPEFVAGNGTCQFNDLKKYARDLFGSGSTGLSLANQMSGFSAGSTQATNLGFDIFAAIADKRNDPSVFTADNISNAANLTVEVIECSKVSASGATTIAAFAAALGSTGGYEVRGQAEDDNDAAVVTADNLSGVNAPTGQDFTDLVGKRTLFYGSPAETFSNEASSNRAYDWSIVQSGTPLAGLDSPALVAICIEFEDTIDKLEDFRVEHEGSAVQTILPLSSAFLACPATLPTVGAASITDRLLALIAPTPLYAIGKFTGSPTGSAGSFSRFEGVDPQAVLVSYASAPKDARKNQVVPGTDGPVAIFVTGANLTPWEGVTVRLSGIDNNGDKIGFTGNVAVTDENGIATFPTLKTGKTGGFRLLAETRETDAGTDSYTQGTKLSDRFNVRP